MLSCYTTDLCEPPTDEDYLVDKIKKHQMVMEMDMQTWRVREPFRNMAHVDISLISAPWKSLTSVNR